MRNADFEQLSVFNVADGMDYKSNTIVMKNIVVEDVCTIQGFAFDFGKVLSQKKSTFVRFIHIIEGKAEVVIDNNSTFMHKGDSILIPKYTASSIEANQKFKMICTTIKSE
jgi:quercetin dioxygenase-like cupin family protein